MSGTRQDQDTRASFSKHPEANLTDGPPGRKKSRLKDLLLTPEARTAGLTPPRPEHRHRAPPSVE